MSEAPLQAVADLIGKGEIVDELRVLYEEEKRRELLASAQAQAP